MLESFTSLRHAAGLTIDEVSAEFRIALSEVAVWDSGLAAPPRQVTQTLQVLARFHDGKSSSDLENSNSKMIVPAESSAGHRKKFGQIFTPSHVADLMADWVVQDGVGCIIDPALGTGNLARAVLARNPSIQFTGVEIDRFVLDEMPEELKRAINVIQCDALTWEPHRHFDGVIMNPPYIRHRELRDHDCKRLEISRLSGVSIPKSANLYVDFVLKACSMLNDGARGAFLIPAEWMSANFSQGLKYKLLDSGWLKALVTFSNCSQIFEGALTTASLLLIEKSKGSGRIKSYFLQSVSSKKSPQTVKELDQRYPSRQIAADELARASKWEPILKGVDLGLPKGWTTLGEMADTRRGIATGSNNFFLVSSDFIDANGIQTANVKKCVGRANDAKGLIFGADDFDTLEASGKKVWLLDFSSNMNDRELAYIKTGELDMVDQRYLTKMRKPWYSMEQRAPAPIWAGVFGRGDLRFVYNAAGARSLTNFHCVYPVQADPTFHRALSVLLNCQEVRSMMAGHQRGYGGGLMKFEPRDLKSIPIPDIRHSPSELLQEIADKLAEADKGQRSGANSLSLEGLINAVTEHATQEFELAA